MMAISSMVNCMKQYTICQMRDCDRVVGLHGAKGYCPLHYRRYRVYGDPTYVKFNQPCRVSGCGNKKQTKIGYCVKHYKRYKRGLDPSLPSRNDYRKHIDMGDHVLLPLTVGALQGYAILDIDYAWLDKYQWSKNNSGYAQANVDGKTTLMHHLVIGKPKNGYVTDHINRNRADNRTVNLRHITQRENSLNKNYGKYDGTA